MSDHYHYEYAEARHDHRGEYAGERHDHDLDYADKHHGHYDLDREDERLKALLDLLRHEVRELRDDLASALGRIRQLEQQTPDARQAEYEADVALADAADGGYDETAYVDYPTPHHDDCDCEDCVTFYAERNKS